MTDNLEIEILPNDNCKELVSTGEVLEQETLEDVVRESDERNSKKVAGDLKALGEEYILAKKRMEEAKLSIKSIIDEAKEIGISKTMLETYVGLYKVTDFNKMVIIGAINDVKNEDEDEE